MKHEWKLKQSVVLADQSVLRVFGCVHCRSQYFDHLRTSGSTSELYACAGEMGYTFDSVEDNFRTCYKRQDSAKPIPQPKRRKIGGSADDLA